MIRIKHFLIYLLVTTAFLSCSNNDDSDTDNTRTFADLQADFSALTFNPGVNDVTLLDFNNFTWNFRVVMPDVDFTDNNRPLIVTLHGYSGGAANAHQFTDCYAEPGFEALDAIILSPNGGDQQWFEPYNQEMVLNLTVLAKQYLPVDGSKVVVNGYSDGGNGAWFFSETHPELYSAGIPMASAYGSYEPDGEARVIPIPVYVIHGENDTLFPLENTQEWVDDTILSGSDVTLVVATGLTHTEPCEYTSYLQDAATWLEAEVW
ncbi:dienelactone hydrolase family protein [Lacinutrix iliipiscaria]|uniref:Dienelactone hydrolase family protein n=1 Tax=Lacinutrix iliipiscaria TaxID=1230532 RepID=A0ABW5WM22_9FLAO